MSNEKFTGTLAIGYGLATAILEAPEEAGEGISSRIVKQIKRAKQKAQKEKKDKELRKLKNLDILGEKEIPDKLY